MAANGNEFTEIGKIFKLFVGFKNLKARIMSGSNHLVANAVRKEHPFEVLLVGMNDPTINFGVRTYFAELMLLAYVKIYPHTPISLPSTFCVVSRDAQYRQKSENLDFLLPQYGRFFHFCPWTPVCGQVHSVGHGRIPCQRFNGDILRTHNAEKFKILLESIQRCFCDEQFVEAIRNAERDVVHGKAGLETVNVVRHCLLLLQIIHTTIRCGFHPTVSDPSSGLVPTIQSLIHVTRLLQGSLFTTLSRPGNMFGVDEELEQMDQHAKGLAGKYPSGVPPNEHEDDGPLYADSDGVELMNLPAQNLPESKSEAAFFDAPTLVHSSSGAVEEAKGDIDEFHAQPMKRASSSFSVYEAEHGHIDLGRLSSYKPGFESRRSSVNRRGSLPSTTAMVRKVDELDEQFGDQLMHAVRARDLEAYAEVVVDVLWERQRWVPGNGQYQWSVYNIFNRNSHPPFVSPTSETVAEYYNEQVDSGVENDQVGPSADVNNEHGLASASAGVRVSEWGWLEPWKLDLLPFGNPTSPDGWLYSKFWDTEPSCWQTEAGILNCVRMRKWVRRRSQLSAEDMLRRLLDAGYPVNHVRMAFMRGALEDGFDLRYALLQMGRRMSAMPDVSYPPLSSAALGPSSHRPSQMLKHSATAQDLRKMLTRSGSSKLASSGGPGGNKRLSFQSPAMPGGANIPAENEMGTMVMAFRNKCFCEVLSTLIHYTEIITHVRVQALVRELQRSELLDGDLNRVFLKNRAHFRYDRGDYTLSESTSKRFAGQDRGRGWTSMSNRPLLWLSHSNSRNGEQVVDGDVVSKGHLSRPAACLLRKIKAALRRHGTTLVEAGLMPWQASNSSKYARVSSLHQTDEPWSTWEPKLRAILIGLDVILLEEETELLRENFTDDLDVVKPFLVANSFDQVADELLTLETKGLSLFTDIFTTNEVEKLSMNNINSGTSFDCQTCTPTCARSYAHYRWLFEIIMHSTNYKLTEKAFVLLMRNAHSKLHFLKTVDNLTLLELCGSNATNARRMQSYRQLLLHSSRRIENWGRGTDGTKEIEVRRVISDCETIIKHMHQEISLSRLSNKRAAHRQSQTIVAQQGTVQVLLRIAQLPVRVHATDEHSSHTAKDSEGVSVMTLKTAAASMLVVLLEDNHAVQKIVEKSMDDLFALNNKLMSMERSHTTLPLSMLRLQLQLVLHSLLANNYKLACKVSSETLFRYGKAIDLWEMDNALNTSNRLTNLSMLETLASGYTAPCPLLQSRVMDVLTCLDFKTVLKTYHNVHYLGHLQLEAGYAERKALMSASASVMPDPENPICLALTPANLELSYHCQLVHLLSKCSRGRVSLQRSKCALMLPLPLIIRVLLEALASMLESFEKLERDNATLAAVSEIQAAVKDEDERLTAAQQQDTIEHDAAFATDVHQKILRGEAAADDFGRPSMMTFDGRRQSTISNVIDVVEDLPTSNERTAEHSEEGSVSKAPEGDMEHAPKNERKAGRCSTKSGQGLSHGSCKVCCRLTPIHEGGGVQFPRWGDTLVIHSYAVFLRHVFLEWDSAKATRNGPASVASDESDRSPEHGGQNELLVDCHANQLKGERQRLESIMHSFSSIICYFVEAVIEKATELDEYDPKYQGPPKGHFHCSTFSVSLCEGTMRCIFAGIVPALYCFYDNQDLQSSGDLGASHQGSSFFSIEEDNPLEATWRHNRKSAFEALGLLTQPEVVVAARAICAVISPSCEQMFEAIWLPSSRRCHELLQRQCEADFDSLELEEFEDVPSEEEPDAQENPHHEPVESETDPGATTTGEGVSEGTPLLDPSPDASEASTRPSTTRTPNLDEHDYGEAPELTTQTASSRSRSKSSDLSSRLSRASRSLSQTSRVRTIKNTIAAGGSRASMESSIHRGSSGVATSLANARANINQQDKANTTLYESMDMECVSELHSQGIVMDYVAEQVDDEEIARVCSRFGKVRLVKRRPNHVVSVYFKEKHADAEVPRDEAEKRVREDAERLASDQRASVAAVLMNSDNAEETYYGQTAKAVLIFETTEMLEPNYEVPIRFAANDIKNDIELRFHISACVLRLRFGDAELVGDMTLADVKFPLDKGYLTIEWLPVIAAARSLNKSLVFGPHPISCCVENSGFDVFLSDWVQCLKRSAPVTSILKEEFKHLVSMVIKLDEVSGGAMIVNDFMYVAIKYVRQYVQRYHCSLEMDGDHNTSEADFASLLSANAVEDEEKREDVPPDQLVKLLRHLVTVATADLPFPVTATKTELLPSELKLGEGNHAVKEISRSPSFNAPFEVVVPAASHSLRQMQWLMNVIGGTDMFVDLLSLPDKPENFLLHREAVRFGIALLQGGNTSVQDRMEEYLCETQNTAFFTSLNRFVRCHITESNGQQHQTRTSQVTSSAATSAQNNPHVSFDEDLLLKLHHGAQQHIHGVDKQQLSEVFRLMQLMCEGHHSGMQHLLRDCRSVYDSKRTTQAANSSFHTKHMQQVGGTENVQIVGSTVALTENILRASTLDCQAKHAMKPSALNSLLTLLQFLTEICEGPCHENQQVLADSLMPNMCNIILNCDANVNFRFAWSHRYLSTFSALKLSAVTLLMSLVEGRAARPDDEVFALLYDKISPDILRRRLDEATAWFQAQKMKHHSPTVILASKADRDRAQANRALEKHTSQQTPTRAGRGGRRESSIPDDYTDYSSQWSRALTQGDEQEDVMMSLASLPSVRVSTPSWHQSYGDYNSYGCSMIVCFLNLLNQLDSVMQPRFYVVRRSQSGIKRQAGKSQGQSDGESKTESGETEGQSVMDGDEMDMGDDTSAIEKDDGDADQGQHGTRKSQHRERKIKNRRGMFEDRVCSIEIQWQGVLVRTFFPRPKVCAFLSDESKAAVREKLDYTVDDGQLIRDFFSLSGELIDEIQHKQGLANNIFLRITTDDRFEIAPWVIALVINLCLLVSLQKDAEHVDHAVFASDKVEMFVTGLGFAQLVLNLSIMAACIQLKGPLLHLKLMRKQMRCRELTELHGPPRPHIVVRQVLQAFARPLVSGFGVLVLFRILYLSGFRENEVPLLRKVMMIIRCVLVLPFLVACRDVCSKRPFVNWSVSLYYNTVYDFLSSPADFLKLAYVFFTCVAVFGQHMETFFAIQLLSLVHFSPTLRNVVKAVSGPISQLRMTAFFGCLVIYVFMAVGFDDFWSDMTDVGGYLADDVQHSTCRTMMSCYLFYVVNGLTTGGGIGEIISNELGNPPEVSTSGFGRYVYDFLFFVLVSVLLLNLIFGIIIDTFSSLRERGNEQRFQMLNKCTVCGLPRRMFEGHNGATQVWGGWNRHYKHEHNLWNYLFFIVHLQSKPSTEHSGVEDYVMQCWNSNNFAWVPWHAALAVPDNTDKDRAEQDRSEEIARLAAMLVDMNNKIDQNATEINDNMTRELDIVKRRFDLAMEDMAS